MDRFIKKRTALKAKLTRIAKANVEELTAEAVQLKLNFLDTTYENLEKNFDDINQASSAEGIAVHQQDFDDSCEKYEELKASLIRKQNALRPSTPASGQSDRSNSATEVRLPVMELPTFSGDFRNWTPFADLFTASIHNNLNLSGSQKLQYLKASLQGEAFELISDFAITDGNYEEAWDLLTKRYQNRREIIYSHIRSILEQNPVNSDPTSLQKLVDTFNKSLRALKVLQQPIGSWDAILCYLLTDKIDEITRRDWDIMLPDDSIPSCQQLLTFLGQRAKAVMAGGNAPQPARTQQATKSAASASRPKPCTCPACSGNHVPQHCSKFMAATPAERLAWIQNSAVCKNCLSSTHSIKTCRSGNCRKCGQRHHTLIHQKEAVTESSMIHQQTSRGSSAVLLATAQVLTTDSNGTKRILRALIDPGSQNNFVSVSVIQALGLPTFPGKGTFYGIGNTPLAESRKTAEITIMSRIDDRFKIVLRAHVMKRVTSDLPAAAIKAESWPHLKGVDLADPEFNKPGKIDLLLGADVYAQIMTPGLKRTSKPALIGQNTKLGWILTGKVRTDNPQENQVSVNHVADCTELMERFWELESVAEKPHLTPEEKTCEEQYEKTTTRASNGRYIVQLPFSQFPADLGESRDMAIARFHQLEKRLQRQPHLKEQYNLTIEDYLRRDHMEPIPLSQLHKREVTYLPHHAIIKESGSTKVRVVFDASAKTSNGHSLNDNLLNGPKTQDNLQNILIRFRTHPIAITADISQMYRQISVTHRDSDYQRILWRSSPNQHIQHYRLKTVTFGTKSAPFLATRTLQQLAHDEGHKFPTAANITKRDFYVDDLLSGTSSVEEALHLQKEITDLLQAGGFSLHKWSSSNAAVRAAIPEQLQARASDLTFDENQTIKTLGVLWNPVEDKFSFLVNTKKRDVHTKRTTLSDMATIFDPLGWLSPVIVAGKIFLQSLWKTPLSWDDELPEKLRQQWEQFIIHLPAASAITIPRFMMVLHMKGQELCGFADASEKAYAAVVYLRATDESGNVKISLVAAKSKVAPLKTVSLPRLELCAALLLTQLTTLITESFAEPIDAINAWTDSTIVLAWLSSSPSNWKTFVANRVATIQDKIPPTAWRHVKSTENPADVASRGITAADLKNHNLWWSGPSWLKTNHYLEAGNPATDTSEVPEKKRQLQSVCHVGNEPPTLLNKCSKLLRLLRITAYMRRFGTNARCTKSDRATGPLTSEELSHAEQYWLKKAQSEAFGSELKSLQAARSIHLKSALMSLNPYLDDNGLIRVGGRLRHANLSTIQKHPIILPKNHRLTQLILEQAHLDAFHAGPQLLAATVRQRYWVVRGRDVFRKIPSKCVTCCKIKGQTTRQMMSDLPAVRVQPGRAFQRCGVDYAGPFQLRSMLARGSRLHKAYVALFICFTTRAIHLELVGDLSTPSFLAALKRFIARRGRPNTIMSDNGTNFIGANKELRNFIKLCQEDQRNQIITDALSSDGIAWKFNPPSAPHFGGLWEAGVKSFKHHLYRILKDTVLNFEEMCTLISQIEAILNSRPLSPISEDPDSYDALTPGHFLIGEPLTNHPEPDLQEQPINRLSRWQLIQQKFQHFWKRWSSEYLSRLQQRPKWWAPPSRPVIKGDLVLIKEDNLPPLKWKLGRVIDTHPGEDGATRVVTVQTTTGTYKRPIVKLSPLPLDASPMPESSISDSQSSP